MRVLVWQWGRFGTGARYALELARALSEHCGFGTLLSLAEDAELMQNPVCRQAVDLPLHTYANAQEFIRRSLFIRSVLRPIFDRLRAAPPDAAIVTMISYWDVALAHHLRRMGVPVVVMVHDAEVHPGDRFHLAVHLQRRLIRISDGVVTLTDYVARLARRRLSFAGKVHATIPHVALDFADLNLPPPEPPKPAPDRPLRLLLAGRLKRYKGLELLAGALQQLDGVPIALRVAGAAQHRNELAALAAFPGVELDLGWKDERTLISHIDWADACILPYVEASQSGVAPLAFGRGRTVIATPVGGLPEQIRDGETGLIAEAISTTALAGSIRRLAVDRNLVTRLGENALHHATSELSWAALGPRFDAVLKAVARRKS